MKQQILETLPRFREVLGLDEDPMGIFYTDEKPAEGFTPKPLDMPTREKEIKNEIDWQTVFGQFSCVLGNIWRARKKQTSAFFSAEQFGCPGGGDVALGAACGSLVVWPLHYLSKGQNKAVLGGWDPSARKFFKTDELSFSVPFEMFVEMLNRFETSFLKTKTWPIVQKKIARSKKAWGES